MPNTELIHQWADYVHGLGPRFIMHTWKDIGGRVCMAGALPEVFPEDWRYDTYDRPTFLKEKNDPNRPISDRICLFFNLEEQREAVRALITDQNLRDSLIAADRIRSLCYQD